MRAIRKHLGDFLAVVAVCILGIGTAGYILSNQRLRFPIIQEEAFRLKVLLPDAQAVTPGQGQTVRVAGVEVGQIGKVELEDGRAVVNLEIEPKHEGLIRRDATALLRSKTGVKDMFIEVDPGDGEPLEENESITVDQHRTRRRPGRAPVGLDADLARLRASMVGASERGGEDLQETVRWPAPPRPCAILAARRAAAAADHQQHPRPRARS